MNNVLYILGSAFTLEVFPRRQLAVSAFVPIRRGEPCRSPKPHPLKSLVSASAPQRESGFS